MRRRRREGSNFRQILNTILVDGNTIANYQLGVGLTQVNSNGVMVCSSWANQVNSSWGNPSVIAPSLTSTGTGRPAVQSDSSLLFDGIANFMKTANFRNTVNQPFIFYIVANPISWNSLAQLYDGNADDTVIVLQQTLSPNVDFYAGTLAASQLAFPLGIFGVLKSLYNGASSAISLNMNNNITGNPGAGTLSGFTLCRHGITSDRFGNFQIKEIIIRSSADSLSTQTTIQSLLGQIHGTP